MKISNLGLSAFYEVASSLNMSQAAGILGVTQSALSQRITALEDDLETALFIREGKSLKLTEAGKNFFLYSQHHKALEDDFLLRFRTTSGEMAGRIRIAAYSSVLRSMIIPLLATFLRDHPRVTVEFSSHEVDELYNVLRSNKADIVISDSEMNKKGITEAVIGNEEYVLIESSRFKTKSNIYLDHDQDDRITELFFGIQKNPPREYQRSYLGDVYAILDGVELGIGKAVMSKHLIQNREIKIINGLKKFTRPIVLQYYERPFYPHLFKKVIELLQESDV